MSDSKPSPKASHSTNRISRQTLTRIIVGAVAFIYGVLFIVLNRSKVHIHFVFFSITSRLWVGLLVCLILGAVLGQALGGTYRRKKSAKADGSTTPDRSQ